MMDSLPKTEIVSKKETSYGLKVIPKKENERSDDEAFCNNGVIAIMDGMGAGGHDSGNIAEYTRKHVAEKIADNTKINGLPTKEMAINEIVYYVKENGMVIGKYRETKNHQADTTISLGVLYINKKQETCLMRFNAGDSRLYLFRDDELIPITKDDSVVQVLIDKEIQTEEEAFLNENRSILLRVAGNFKTSEEVFKRIAEQNKEELVLKQGDLIIGMSDGYLDNTPPEERPKELRRIIKSLRESNNLTPGTLAERLAGAAKLRQSWEHLPYSKKDDISVAVMEIGSVK